MNVPNSGNTIKLPLRRTLVRSVLYSASGCTFKWLQICSRHAPQPKDEKRFAVSRRLSGCDAREANYSKAGLKKKKSIKKSIV